MMMIVINTKEIMTILNITNKKAGCRIYLTNQLLIAVGNLGSRLHFNIYFWILLQSSLLHLSFDLTLCRICYYRINNQLYLL